MPIHVENEVENAITTLTSNTNYTHYRRLRLRRHHLCRNKQNFASALIIMHSLSFVHNFSCQQLARHLKPNSIRIFFIKFGRKFQSDFDDNSDEFSIKW